MLSLKKLKLYIFLGGIFISLIFSFALLAFSSQALAIDVLAPSSLSTRPLADSVASIINAFVGLTGAIALVIIVYGGYLWMFSGGDPKKIDKAKKVLISATIGLVIILLSWAIVSFIFNAVGGGDGGTGPGTGPGPLPGGSSNFKVRWISPKDDATDVPICHRIVAGFADNNGNPIILNKDTVDSTSVKIREYCDAAGSAMDQCAAHRPSEDANDNGVFDPAEDTNGDDVFTPFDPGEDINRNGIFDLTADACMGDGYCRFNMTTAGAFTFEMPVDETFGFTPAKEWDKDTRYWIYINGVQSASASVANPFNSFFTTGELSDNTPPTVAAVSPADDPTNTPKVCRTKPIMAQFSEDIWPASLKKINPPFHTLATTDTNYASLEIDPVLPASLAFGLSQIQPDIAVYSPLYPFDKNKTYHPVFRAGEDADGDKTLDAGEDLNGNSVLDGIEDMCGNFLDQVPADTFYGTPRGDYGDPGSANPDVIDYSFTTEDSDNTICDPQITGIDPVQSYYDAPQDIVTISGKNFGDIIPRTVLFSSGVTVDASTDFCFDPLAVPAYTNDGWVCIQSWQDDKIKIALPARGTTTSAVDGPVQVKLGGYAACDANICIAGANKGQACTDYTECLSGDSNTDFSIDIQSPHISSQSPSEGPKGQWITLNGTDFGIGDTNNDKIIDGKVRFIRRSDNTIINGNFPCSASWTDTQIIVELPIDAAFNVNDILDIQIERPDGRHSNFGTFKVNTDPLGPGVCSLSESCGEAGTVFNIAGKRFGAVQGTSNVIFKSSAETNADYTGAGFSWSDEAINNVKAPAGITDGNYSVFVRTAGPPIANSNGMSFKAPCTIVPLVCSDPNLTAVWKFDEAAGDAAVDSTDNNNQGVLQNSPTRLSTGCKFGKCLEFDGNDDNVDIGTGFTDSIEGAGTIETWVYRIGSTGAIFSRSTGSSWIDERLVVFFRNDTNQWGWSFADGTSYQNPQFPIATFPANTWTHFALTWDGSTVATYLNGVVFDTRVQTVTPDVTGAKTRIGWNEGIPGGNWSFSGRIDEIRVWNKALDISEIKSIYNQQCEALDKISCSDPNLKAVWKLDENSGIVANDSTGNHNDGQLNNNPTWKSGADCKFGNCLSFDGNDDYIKISDSDNISMTSAITMEAWVKTNDSKQQYIFSKHNSSADINEFEYTLLLNADGIIRAEFHNTSGNYENALGISNIADDNWHHIAATFDGNNIKIYNNGILESTTPWISSISSNSAKYLYIGRLGRLVGDGTRYFNGSIDEPRVWDKALTQEEIISAMSQECKVGGTGATLQCTNDVVGLWNFDEGNGTLAADGSRNRNDGTVSGGAVWNSTGCQFGKCLNFDGTDDYVSVANESDFDFTPGQSITLEAWVRPTNLLLNNAEIIVAKGRDGHERNFAFDVYGFVNDTGKLRFFYRDATTPHIYTANDNLIANNAWYHVAATYTYGIASSAKLYINGVEVAGSWTSGNGNDATTTNNLSVRIGAEVDSSSDEYFDGTIDEVRIYNRALSAAEIENTYQKSMNACQAAPLICSDPNLAAVWKFDEAAGDAAVDSTANNNQGVLQNSPTRLSTGCKFGKCLEFDGAASDQYIQISDSPSLDLTGDMTVELWIKPGATQNTYTDILSKHGGVFTGFVIEQKKNNTNEFVFAWGDGSLWNCNSANGATPSITLTPNVWQHAAFVKSGATMSYYLNGSPTGSVCTGSLSVIAPNNDPLRIAQWSTSTGREFNGSIDEVRIWNKALDISEIKSIYNQQCEALDKISCSDPNLKAVWKLDENSGIAANDSTANNNDGQLNNNPTWESADCKFGKCLKFDGDNDEMDMDGPLTFDPTKGFTFEAWANVSDTDNGHGALFSLYNKAGATDPERYLSMFILEPGLSVPGPEAGFELCANTCLPTIEGDTSHAAIPLIQYNTNTWQHYAIVLDTPNLKGRLYIDGILVKNYNLPAIPFSDQLLARIGGSYWNGLSMDPHNLKGSIDEPRIWDKALTQEEIISAMSQECKVGGTGATLQCTNDVAGLWNFDEGAGNMATDGSRNRNNGILKNGLDTSWNSNSCQFGKCLNLDGTDDYISINNSLNIPKDGDFTMSVFFKANSWRDSSIACGPNQLLTNHRFVLGEDGGTFQFATKNDSFDWTGNRISAALPSIGEWHNAIAVRKQNYLELYIDGQFIGKSPNDFGNTSIDKIWIGGEHCVPGRNTFDGSIDEVRIYSRALSAAEIENTYQKSMNTCQAAPLICSDPNLVSVWKFDEDGGAVALDSSTGGVNDGTLTNNPTRLSTGCKFGKCLSFDGVDDYVSVSRTAVLNALVDGDHTFEMWVKSSETAITKRLFAMEDVTSGFHGAIFNYPTAGKVSFYDGNGADADSLVSVASNLNNGEWHHLSFVLGGATQRIYIDGNFDSSRTRVAGSYEDKDFFIGTRSTLTEFFKGQIDEVRLWNKALKESEIKSIYNQACMNIAAISCENPNLKAVWKLDENLGIAAGDSSGNHNDGQLNNNPTWESADCKFGKCLSFDGVDDYIDAGNNPIFNFGDGTNDHPFTFEAWVKRNTTDSTDVIFSKYYTLAAFDRSQYWFRGLDNGQLDFGLISGNGDYRKSIITNNSPLGDTNWHHVAATYDGSKTVGGLKLYVDGFAATTNITSDNSSYVAMKATTATFQIGRYTDSLGGGGNFNGSIDEPRIWDKALTQEEIISAMSQECKVGGTGATLSCNNDVVGLWNFDEGQGSMAADGSRNRNDGTVSGGAVWNTTGCQFGKCLNMSSANDYVQMSASNSTTGSVELWAKPDVGQNGKHILTFGNGYGGNFDKVHLVVNGSGNYQFGFYGMGGACTDWQTIDSGITAMADIFAHLTGTWDSSGIKFYVNGQFVGSNTNCTSGITNSPTAITIGDNTYGTANFNGSIDEVRIYSRALSATEIENTYQKSMNQCQAAPLVCSNPALAGVWKFDEAAGDAAVDSTDNNNQGVLQNSPTRLSTGCKFGKCLSFDGDNDYVNIADSASLDFVNNMTIELWTRPDEIQKSFTDIISNHRDYAGFTIEQTDSSNNEFVFSWGDGDSWSGDSVSSPSPISINLIPDIWQHLAVVKKDSKVEYYLNGLYISGYTSNNLPVIAANNSDLHIGNWPASPGREFKGQIDEVRLWNKALEESEIKSIYNQACMNVAAISCENPNLKAVWKLDENLGIAANDSTANNNDGQLNNNPTWESADCKFGKCLKFDGDNDEMDMDGPLTFDPTKGFTFEAWANVSDTDNGHGALFSLYNKAGATDPERYLSMFILEPGLSVPGPEAGFELCANTCLPTIEGDTSHAAIPLIQYNTNTWQHYAIVLDTPNLKGRLYIDGILVKNYNLPAIPFSDQLLARIGGSYWGGLSVDPHNLKGLIDEPRIWDKALTQEEIISAMSQECKVGGAGATLSCNNDVVGLWNFDEAGGSFVGDGSQYRNNGMLIPIQVGPWSTGCQFGGCVKLNGATQYIDIPDNSSLDVSNETTVMLWANIESIDSANDGDDVLLDKMTSENKGPFGILLEAGNSFKLEGRFILSDATQIKLRSDFVPPAHQWHHYAITFKSGEQKMYYDSKEVALNNAVGKLIQNNLPVYIGKGVNREYYTYAAFDEVRIYNRALSATEIANTYQKSMTQCVEATLYCSNPELTAVWKMDEGIGVVSGDSTANNLDGVLKNGLNSVGVAGTGWKSGADCKFTDGKCLEFDGINNNPTNPADADISCTTTKDSCSKGDIIEIPDSSIVDFGKNPFTIEGWVKMPPAATVLDTLNYSGTVGPGVPGTLISKQSSGSVAGFVIHTNNSSCGDGTLYFRVNDAIGSPDYDSKDLCSGNISDNEWHHFAALREGTAIRLYIDGLRIGEANASKVQSVNNDYPLYIGGYRNEGDWPNWFPAKFKGSLDELRIWKKALTDDQIRGIYNGGNGQQCLAPQKGSACDLDLTAPSCQPNVGLCESGDPNLRCSIKSCTCQPAFAVNPPPVFAPDSGGLACRNTAITVNFNENIDASTIKTATTTVKEKAPPLLSENFNAGLPAGWVTTKTDTGAEVLNWQGIVGQLYSLTGTAAGWLSSPNALSSTTNFRISFDTGSLGDGNNAIGIAWNYIDKDNYYRLIWEDPTDSYASLYPSRLVLQKRVNGALVENASVTNSDIVGRGLVESGSFVAPVNQSVHFYIDVVGTKITVSNDSGTLLSYDDSSAPAILPGKIAFFTLDSDGGIFYDNLIVTEYEATNIPGTVELYSLQAATGNLLAGGDMEDSKTDIWKQYETPKVIEKSTVEKKNGKQSLHIITDEPDCDSCGRHEGVYATIGIFNPGDRVRVKGWVKVVKGNFIAATSYISSNWKAMSPILSVGDWREFTVDLEWPSSSPAGPLSLWFAESDAPDSEFYVDDISVTVEHNLAVDISTAVNGSTLTITPRQYLDADRNYTLNFAGDHLVSLWNFDEGSGTTVKDWRGGMNGALVGSPLWKSGADCKFGSCLEFDGKDGVVQYVNAGNFAGKYSNQLTVSAWIKNNSSRAGMTSTNIDWDDIIAGSCGDFVFYIGSGGEAGIQRQCGVESGLVYKSVSSSKKVNDDQWHHVAATYNGTTLRIYVDGKPDGETLDVSGIFRAGNLWIGSTFYDGELFSGRIDDARIWSRALTDKEIADVANGGAPNPGNGNVIFSSNGNPLEKDYVWDVSTGTEICKIGKAEIQFTKGPTAAPITYKGSDSFTCAASTSCVDDMSMAGGNQHQPKVNIYSANGGPLGGVMTYKWTKSTDAPFDIINDDDIDPLTTAKSTNGQGVLTVDVNGGDAGTAKASANVTIALCENPWLGDQASVPWTESDTNFSVWYCRDAGNMQDTTDDLPNLTVQEVTTSPGSPKPMKEYFYYDANSVNDAIGIRVYANPGRLPLTEWLDQNANVSGGQSGSFNGWQSVRAGRSLYVSAMNDVGSGIYNNIYLISYSDKSSGTLIGIYNQMIGNWKFMVNGISDADIAKLQRDIRRIDDLGKIATALDSYKTKNGSYPKLDAGTYLPGMSTSVWPSWQATLGNALQTPIPKDPINQLSNLVGYWKLDEGTGIAANDSSARGNTGRLMNNPVWKSGADCKVGGCLELNASDNDDYVIINPISDFPTTEITTAYWTKTSDSGDGIISYGSSVTPNNDWLIFSSDNISPHRDASVNTGVSVNDNAWHFVAVAWKSSNGEVKVYKDGILAKTAIAIIANSVGTTITPGGSLVFGQDQDSVGGEFDATQTHTGLIDEVQIYNRALSGSEIALLAGGGFSEATGWNQDTNSFRCDAGTDFDSHIYHYQYKSSTDFDLYAALEYDRRSSGGSTWRQREIAEAYAPCTNPSQCACYNYEYCTGEAGNECPQLAAMNLSTGTPTGNATFNSGVLSLKTGRPITPYLWVANSDIDMVTRISTSEADLFDDGAVNGSDFEGNTAGPFPAGEDTNGNGVFDVGENDKDGDSVLEFGDNPSRTAVDLNNNVWIGSRDSSTLTKMDVNGNIKKICGGVPGIRGIAVDAFGNIWIGNYSANTISKFSGDDTDCTKLMPDISVAGNPYGLAIDGENHLWVVLQGLGGVQRIDVLTGMTSPAFALNNTPYGIAIDQQNNVWVAQWDFHVAKVPMNATDNTSVVYYNNGATVTWGSTGMAIDGSGNVWISNYANETVTKLDNNGNFIGTYDTCNFDGINEGRHPHGITAVADQTIWSICLTAQAAHISNNGAPIAITNLDGGNTYTYSDMAGYALRSITLRQGQWTGEFDSGKADSIWKEISWTENEPPGTLVQARARSSNDKSTWSAWTPYYPTSPANIFGTAPNGRYLQVEFQFKTNNEMVTPQLSNVRVKYILQ